MAQTVVGVFDNSSDAQRAVDSLVSNGFTRDNIDISAATTGDMTGSTGNMSGSTGNMTGSTTTGRDATHDGDDFGDSVGKFFTNLFGGGSDDTTTTRSYSNVARQGSVVTVHTTTAEESERAADVLDECGAVNVDERAAQYATGNYQAGAMTTGATTGLMDTDMTKNRTTADGTMSVPILEETLSVGKQMVETGGVRLRSRIVERPVEESVRLREERVVVQRNPVNRAATDADFGTFKEGDIEMVEHAERAVVAKEARVVEEVTLGKEATERDETIRDTVRKTEVDVENIGNTTNVDTTRRTGTGL